MKLRLLPGAISDLKELRAYIAIDDPVAANRIGQRLDKAMLLLSRRPEIGRPTSRGSVREWAVPGLPYVIPYRLANETVEILRIYHTSRKRPEE